MVYIFIKLVWNSNPIYPSLRIVSTKNDQFSELPLIIGDEFNIIFRGRKLCIGSELSEFGWLTCVANQNRLNKPFIKLGIQQERGVAQEYIQCLDCRQSNYFACRQICIGKECNPSSQDAYDACQGPNTSVYLTQIGGQTKVGVSLNVNRRWLEQGSDYAVELVKMPGLEARRLEQQISKELGLKLQVRNTTKIRNFQPEQFEYGSEELENKYDQSKEIISRDYSSTEKKPVDGFVVEDLTPHYGNLNINRPIQTINFKPKSEFGGTIEAIKGSIIVVRNGLYLYGLDTKTLTSHTFSLLDRKASLGGQRSLDEWY
ncbi:MAG: hypothetical protein HeimC2_14820 [Candidatus Heimdallarchaeota archaeon LC_2]|nr:MAG: hypothetical protein HeimC2_14820 [Candidatus Heimdallarchaeota archaeon LC_2]